MAAFGSPIREKEPGSGSTMLSSPTARRQAAGRAHPAPLELSLSPKTRDASRSPHANSPPRSKDGSLSPSMLSSTPPITPTRKTPTTASSLGEDNSAKQDRIFRPNGRGAAGMDSISNVQSPASTAERAAAASGGPTGRSQRAASFAPSSTNSSAQRRPSIIGYNVSRRTSSFQQQAAAGSGGGGGGGAMTNTRFLLTVVPPSHLPHDPPHPKSNPNCSGYGPPEHFKRGTLIPLYPTLSSQLAAIAREYGLPSTGGLVLYLLSTSDPNSSVQAPLPGAAGFEGGPRISEEAWNLLWRRLFEDEEEIMILAESDDEDGYAPPVPPIPLSHRQNPSDGTSSAEPTYTSYSAQQQSTRRVASESDQALFSDGGEQELERTSFSSEGDHEGSVYSGGVVENGVAEGSKGNSADRRSSARSAIGRGHPSTLPSPSTSTRFASAPVASGSRYSSYSQPNMRHPSRQSVRSNASRFGRSSYAPSGRATAMSNYSSPQLGGEAFGAAVVVGKVEFDIDRRRGGKSKWYEGWIESAADPASGTVSGGTSSIVASPLVRQGVEPEEPTVAQRSLVNGGTELDSTPFNIDFPLPPSTSTRSVGGLAPARGLRPLELSRSASPTGSFVEKPEDPMSPESVAASGYSNAAAAGHGDDESIDDRARSPSIALSHSRNSSLASSVNQHPGRGYAPLEDADAAPYAQLEDEDGSNPFESGRQSRQSQAESEESDYDAQVQQVERGEQEQALKRASEVAREREGEEQESRTATLPQGDPLGDVFPDDEATWRTLSQEPGHVNEKDMVETTGLGIVGARVLDLKADSAPGVVERSPEEETSDEAGVVPPQDDVADVVQLLKSGQSEDKTDKVNLASPIRLDSSPSAPSATGVFEDPTHSFDDSRPPFDDSGISFDTASGPFENEPFKASSTSDEPTDLAARRRSSLQRPRFGSGASARALNLVSIDVRPPSTGHSSPEYAPQRKQRQGWTTVPPVVDPSMSASTSLASLDSYEQPESQRESTIGLMENLDDLERALADLSPTTSRKSPAIGREEPTPEPSPRALPEPAFESMQAGPEKEIEVPEEEAVREPERSEVEQDQELEKPAAVEEAAAEQEEEEKAPSEEHSYQPLKDPVEEPAPVAPAPPFASTSRSATASPVLGSRPPFRYGASSSNVLPSPSLPPSNLEPPPRPPRGDSLNVVTDSSADQEEQEIRPQTPAKSQFDSIPLAGAFSSPEQMPLLNSSSEPAAAPGDPARTPRTSSLSRGTPRAAHQVALPPSPMPPQTESAWHEATTPTPPSHSFAPPPPSSPRQPFVSQRPAPPMPPIPTEEDVITLPDPPQRSPKSPSGFKALRNKSSWKKLNKEIDVARASASTADKDDSSEATKSPVTGFFAKPAFQKLGGMFNKKSGADPSPDSFTSTSMGGAEPSAIDQRREAASLSERQSTSTPPPPDAFPTRSASRQESNNAQQESSYPDNLSQLPPAPPVDYSKVTTASFPGDLPSVTTDAPFAANSSDDRPLLRPTPTPLASSSYTLLPAGSSDSFRSAMSSLPVTADSTSPSSPAEQSLGNVTPTDGTFATSYASSSSFTPLPPLPYDNSSADANEYSVSSPRSEFGAPQTPVQGPSGYAASAPATPAAWSQNKHYLEPGSRFGKGVSSSGGRQAAKQQLSADIDQLLSQMNEIDFGGEEDGASSLAETSRTSENETTQELSPVVGSSSGVGEDSEEQEALDESFDDKRSRLASMDVGSSLGGLMMSASPPTTPSIYQPA